MDAIKASLKLLKFDVKYHRLRTILDWFIKLLFGLEPKTISRDSIDGGSNTLESIE
jgi:hypothetical protein